MPASAGSLSHAPLPLGLSWKKTNDIPRFEKFRYVYGDPQYGYIKYLAKSDIYELETELGLYYRGRMLSSVLFIFGPGGINNTNCLDRYREIITLLNTKYGHFVFQKKLRDSDANDLFYTRPCTPISIGLEEISTTWKTKEFQVEAWLFGPDQDGELFIEVEYIKLKPPKGPLDAEMYKIL